jgi:hypothetical protein
MVHLFGSHGEEMLLPTEKHDTSRNVAFPRTCASVRRRQLCLLLFPTSAKHSGNNSQDFYESIHECNYHTWDHLIQGVFIFMRKKYNEILNFLKKQKQNGHPWLKPVILAACMSEIKMITALG